MLSVFRTPPHCEVPPGSSPNHVLTKCIERVRGKVGMQPLVVKPSEAILPQRTGIRKSRYFITLIDSVKCLEHYRTALADRAWRIGRGSLGRRRAQASRRSQRGYSAMAADGLPGTDQRLILPAMPQRTDHRHHNWRQNVLCDRLWREKRLFARSPAKWGRIMLAGRLAAWPTIGVVI